MVHSTTPHTQTQQDTNFAQTDVNPDELAQNTGRGDDAESYDNREGAQMGAQRSPRRVPASQNPHNVQEQTAAYEGTLESRVQDDRNKQGVTNRSSHEEAVGQQKVVSQREDSQAGVNHSGKIPSR